METWRKGDPLPTERNYTIVWRRWGEDGGPVDVEEVVRARTWAHAGIVAQVRINARTDDAWIWGILGPANLDPTEELQEGQSAA